MEKIFVRCEFNGVFFMKETEAELAFEINGFRFFYHHYRITDGFCGMKVAEWHKEPSKQEFIDAIHMKIKKIFLVYISQIKKRRKAHFRSITDAMSIDIQERVKADEKLNKI